MDIIKYWLKYPFLPMQGKIRSFLDVYHPDYSNVCHFDLAVRLRKTFLKKYHKDINDLNDTKK